MGGVGQAPHGVKFGEGVEGLEPGEVWIFPGTTHCVLRVNAVE